MAALLTTMSIPPNAATAAAASGSAKSLVETSRDVPGDLAERREALDELGVLGRVAVGDHDAGALFEQSLRHGLARGRPLPLP